MLQLVSVCANRVVSLHCVIELFVAKMHSQMDLKEKLDWRLEFQ